MFNKIKSIFQNDIAAPIGLFVMILQFFMLVNISLFFPNNPEGMFNVMLIYLVGLALSFSVTDFRVRLFSTSTKTFSKRFLASFIFTFIVTSIVLALFSVPLSKIGSINIPLIMFNSFVIAYSEENIFRMVLPVYLSDFTSNLIFALFHWTAYDASIPSIAAIFGISFIWTYLRDKYPRKDGVKDASSAIGSHAGYDVPFNIFKDALKAGAA